MEFGSKFAFLSAADEAEEIDEEALDMPLSSAVSSSSVRPVVQEAKRDEAVIQQEHQQQQQQQPQPQPQPQPQQQSRSMLASLGDFLSSVRGTNNNNNNNNVPLAAAAPKLATTSAPVYRPPHQRQRIRREVDTNVVAIRFSDLAKDAEDIFAGDPVFCEKCKAALSKTSKLVKLSQYREEQKQQKQKEQVVNMELDASSQQSENKEELADENENDTMWRCEFCDHENVINIVAEEIPTNDSRDYVVAPSAQSSDSKSDEQGSVIFCIDVSGSMCVSKEVPGTLKLRGRKDDLSAFGNLSDVERPGRSNTTWVSRLQCVQAAVDHQIQSWSKKAPDKRVGLVTFSNQVSIIGDGSHPIEYVTGDKLNDQAQLQEIGGRFAVSKSVVETHQVLSEKLFALEESGATALGPALLVAVSMAAAQAGSRVVICTDGLANVGLGALDSKDEAKRQVAEQWYEGVANLAKLAGVSVSVISIQGDECSLEDLGRVADITGGAVDRVDPLNLTQNFASILENPVIATHVNATFILHHGLKFRNEDDETNKLTRELGNVSRDTEITFEYTVKSRDQLSRWAHNLKSFPFQVQINYTKLDGMKCVRIISKSQEITYDRNQAETHARVDLLAANAQQQAAKFAERGDFFNARAQNRAYGNVFSRINHASPAPAATNQVYSRWMAETEEFDTSLQQQQARVSAHSSNITDTHSRAKAAKAVRGDADYNAMKKFKGKTSNAFK